jgi:nitrogen-specific signal transduction histidine kinase
VSHDNAHAYVDVRTLSNVVINEASKTYLTKLVDEENKYGVFAGYKQLVGRVSDMITEIDPDYKYPHMLVSTIVEGAHHQRFFQDHLPRLTDVVEGEDSVTQFYLDLVRNALRIVR